MPVRSCPNLKSRIELYKGNSPLFDLYSLEPEIDKNAGS